MTWTRSKTLIGLVAAAALTLAGCSAGSSTSPTTATTAPATSAAATTSQATAGSQVTGGSQTAGGSETSGGESASATSGSETGGPASSSAPTASDAALSIGFVLEPTSLDFTQADGAAIPQVLLTNIYETLVKQDQDGKIVPGLAESWTVSDDGKTYTFKLRDGVKFTNGADFTADDAVFSIEQVKTKWKPAVKAAMDVVDKAEAVSPTELKVTLKNPSNSWLFKMTTRVGAMFSKTGVADLATKPIGTGPYTFTSWTRGDNIVLTRNENYWGSKPNVKTVTFRYFQDPTAMNNALLTGGIQVISTVQTPDTLSQFDDTSKYKVVKGDTNGEVMMTINNTAKPLDDIKVRQAINYALDKKAILEGAWAGYGTVIGSHESPLDPWYVDLAGKYPHDVAKAKQLLAEAGQSALTLKLTLPPFPYAAAAAPIIISQLKEAGITVEPSNVTFDVWLDQVFDAGKNDYQLTIINHVEPRDIGTVFSGDPTSYYTHYDNPEVVKLLASADAGSAEEQVTDMKKVVNILADDAAAAWLWSFPNLMVSTTAVGGLPVNAVGEAFDLTALTVS
jgi:peptide/nickel transport system substrate-binding protein